MTPEAEPRGSVLDRVIKWSLDNRLVVALAALAISAYGVVTTMRMPVDVFPDLTAPTVTVVTEAHGLAPQEVETLVTFPIESAMNGATGVRRVRSSSGIGISIVWVEFDWGTDIRDDRQIVAEKLQLAASQLPPDVGPPVLAPTSSVMGEILFIALSSKQHTPLELREAAEWSVRKRLVAISGVAQVVPIGGGLRQFQVLVDPRKLAAMKVSLEEVIHALGESNQNSTGGFYIVGQQEKLIRGVGRLGSEDDIARVAVKSRGGLPILVGQVARVVVGPALKRGEGSAMGEPAVVMGILKQPGANTLVLTRSIDRALAEIQRSLPAGMQINAKLFRQSTFISTAVRNVTHALRDGAILVAIIIFLFLLNVRATLISLAALPVSLIVAMLAMNLMGISINTMSLGGLTIAMGALVDDAIIDVENVYRRLRENQARPEAERRPTLQVIYDASREVRGSILFATLIVMLVFLPIFFLSGLEGRLLAPLGFAYLVSIGASLVVALTLTPVMCAYLFPAGRKLQHDDSIVVRALKRLYRPSLRAALRLPWVVIGSSVALLAGAIAVVPFLGRTFLPEFNEGALTISAVTLPGTSLEKSDELGRRIEKILLELPEVVATDRRTGRAELDEHAQDVNASEIDVRLRKGKRSRAAFLADARSRLSAVPGVIITIGGPLAHRIDHMLSGTRAAIAVKLFGDDLYQLRIHAERIRAVMSKVSGAVDVSVEQQTDVPQLAITFKRDRIARYNLRTGALAEAIEGAYAGHKVTQVLQNQRTYDLVVRYRDEHRADLDAIRQTPIDTPNGMVPLGMLADIRADVGPNTISRENVQRKTVIMANVGGRDLGGVIDDIRKAIEREVPLPEGYYVVYGGQFESQRDSSRTILWLGGLVIAGIFLLLFLSFRSMRSTLLIMVNLPLALIGGVFGAWVGGGILSVGSLVGFITLFGIATRNGIMMISHYEHLMKNEGASLDEAVERGSMERLSPILMTALCAGLALIPLVLNGGAPGNEIQAPMGIVILGGLLSSTALNMIVVPVLYHRLAGRRVAPAPLEA